MTTSKTTSKTSKASTPKIDVIDMKGNVVARVAKLRGKMGVVGAKARNVAETRLVEWRVTELDTKAHAWCEGMKLSYYVECLTYWNEVAVQLEGWGLDVRKLDCNVWNGAWRAWGRGVTQAKLIKKLFVAGYGANGQTQKEARGKTDGRTREERQAAVDKLLSS